MQRTDTRRMAINRIASRVFVAAIVFLAGIAPRVLAQSSNDTQSSPPSQQTTQQAVQAAQQQDSDTDAQGNQPSLLTPLTQHTEDAPYVPITSRQRLRWFITDSIGPSHLAGGVFSSALGTVLDRPKEYGPGWGGFGDRYGMRLTGIVTGNAMEAGIGSLWGEDPHYFRVPEEPIGSRVRNIVKQTFYARRREGDFAPAYARYTAVAGNNFLSNEWRVSSEANTHDALIRTGEGFAGRMAANAWEEFWPDIDRRLFHHKG